MQHNVILEPEPWGLPLRETLLPERLRDLGYTCRAVGKWHLGFHKKAYTPTYRGFQSFYGLWNGHQDYYTHTVQATFASFEGFDMRRDLQPDWSSAGKYSTHLFTEEAVDIIHGHNSTAGPLFLYVAHLAPHAGPYADPLQAPPEVISQFDYIKDKNRQKYAAMVKALDDSVGKIVDTLRAKEMLDNTVLVFVSDNGAPTNGMHRNHGSNWPLKGEKGTPWEGAVRTAAFVWSRLLSNRRRVSRGLMHITDWMPTLYRAAGGDPEELDIDGIDMWDLWANGASDGKWPRKHLVQNIDDVSGYSAIRDSNYKYINGSTFLGFLDYWSGEPDESNGDNYRYEDAVLNSTVGRILLSSDVGNDRVAHGRLLSPATIRNLREESRVKCGHFRKEARPCLPLKKPCLFNVEKDPCELVNLNFGPDDKTGKLVRAKIQHFERLLQEYRRTALVPPGNRRAAGKAADPRLHNGTWSSWEDQDQQIY
ncbi:arylsulfatase B-like isoform X2 [Adelges cooleyi]|nr:arylsulfatase B-like isoform X2 [Adelges cooleyi]